MKKFLALLLAIVMVAMLVGCVTDAPNKQNVEISRGKIVADVYKNEYLGFEFTKPASWVYSTDEEIAAAMNLAVDKLLGDNYKEALENNPAIYDMMVVDTITRTNINIVYENLKKRFHRILPKNSTLWQSNSSFHKCPECRFLSPISLKR